MDKASAHGAGDCRFESCRDHLVLVTEVRPRGLRRPPDGLKGVARSVARDSTELSVSTQVWEFPGGAGNIRWSQEVARVTFLGSRM